MSQDYHTQVWERDDNAARVIKLTLDKTPTAEEWQNFQLDAVPSLNKPDDMPKFEQLTYMDGNVWDDGLDHHWSCKDAGLIGCHFRGNEIMIWAQKTDISPSLFVSIARELLSEISRHDLFKDAAVTKCAMADVCVDFRGDTLSEAAATFKLSIPRPPVKKPKTPQSKNPKQ